MSPAAEACIDPGAAAGTTVAMAVGDLKLRLEVIEAMRKDPVEVIEENCPSAGLEELISSLTRLTPDILMLGLTGLAFDPALALERIAGLDPAPRVVVVNDSAEPETILKVMRAGAAEFVYPPLGPGFGESMRRIVTECRRVPHDGRTMGGVIGFVSAKGGCGATTLACHAAVWLRRAAKKEILLADLDMSAGMAGVLMKAPSRYSLADALQHLHRLDLKLWKTLVAEAPSGVHVLPAAGEPLDNMLASSRKLPHLIRFWRAQYELSILDLGHGMNPGLCDVADSVDTLVVVATDELPALRQARQMIQLLAARNLGANRLRLVINRMPKRAQIQLPELEKVMGLPIYFSIPNDYPGLNEAYSQSRLMEPGSELALRIGSLMEKLTRMIPAAKKPRGILAFWREK
jgi:pilus assembly protein CpaE